MKYLRASSVVQRGLTVSEGSSMRKRHLVMGIGSFDDSLERADQCGLRGRAPCESGP